MVERIGSSSGKAKCFFFSLSREKKKQERGTNRFFFLEKKSRRRLLFDTRNFIMHALSSSSPLHLKQELLEKEKEDALEECIIGVF